MITEHHVNGISSKTVAKLEMGWTKQSNKAKEFQDSFPKIDSTEILSTSDGTRME